MTFATNGPTCLALSGGGTRAMMFHLGVLRYMAEQGKLERIDRVSTVSGGSLLIGLILGESSMRWPSSEHFMKHVLPTLREKICTHRLVRQSLRRLVLPWNWKFALSRANLLAIALEKEWGVVNKLSDLPSAPEISINGTPAENGKRFRFKRDKLGDYTIGYAPTGDYQLANALAVSAAVPGIFGPLVLEMRQFKWERRPYFGAPEGSEVPVTPKFDCLHLYDGGVYDNLGIEPFFDAGKRLPKEGSGIVIVSDGGAPLKEGFSFRRINPFRFKRFADILSDQSRSLRVRGFMSYLTANPGAGAYLYIDTPTNGNAPGECPLAKRASHYPTTLCRPTFEAFDAISEHGYAVATRAASLYGLGI